MKGPIIAVEAAANILAGTLGGAAHLWTFWVKQCDRAGQIPLVPGRGRPRVHLADVERFILAERAGPNGAAAA